MVESIAYLKFIFAFIFVIGTMYLLSWGLRRTGLGGSIPLPTGKQRRLKIVEILPLDAKRRLVLLRRDNQEHLVILGAANETVVETNIPAQEPVALSIVTSEKKELESA